MKESKFFSILVLAIAFMLTLTINSFAQEEMPPVEEEVVEEEVVEEAVTEEPDVFMPSWIAKAYLNFGPIEPWGDPGSGALFNMGMRIE